MSIAQLELPPRTPYAIAVAALRTVHGLMLLAATLLLPFSSPAQDTASNIRRIAVTSNETAIVEFSVPPSPGLFQLEEYVLLSDSTIHTMLIDTPGTNAQAVFPLATGHAQAFYRVRQLPLDIVITNHTLFPCSSSVLWIYSAGTNPTVHTIIELRDSDCDSQFDSLSRRDVLQAEQAVPLFLESCVSDTTTGRWASVRGSTYPMQSLFHASYRCRWTNHFGNTTSIISRTTMLSFATSSLPTLLSISTNGLNIDFPKLAVTNAADIITDGSFSVIDWDPLIVWHFEPLVGTLCDPNCQSYHSEPNTIVVGWETYGTPLRVGIEVRRADSIGIYRGVVIEDYAELASRACRIPVPPGRYHVRAGYKYIDSNGSERLLTDKVGATIEVSGGFTPDRYYIRVYNVDDYGYAYVNTKWVAFQTYATDSGWIDVTDDLRQGRNTITFNNNNLEHHWTYGFAVKRNSTVIYDESCGTAGDAGYIACDWNNTVPGYTVSRSFDIDL